MASLWWCALGVTFYSAVHIYCCYKWSFYAFCFQGPNWTDLLGGKVQYFKNKTVILAVESIRKHNSDFWTNYLQWEEQHNFGALFFFIWTDWFFKETRFLMCSLIWCVVCTHTGIGNHYTLRDNLLNKLFFFWFHDIWFLLPFGSFFLHWWKPGILWHRKGGGWPSSVSGWRREDEEVVRV